MNENTATKELPVLMAGSNRGGLANLQGIARFNDEVPGAKIFLACIDAVPGRAEELAAKAREQNIKAIGGTENIENIIFEGEKRPPIVLAIDRAEAVCQVIRNSEESRQTLLGQLLVKTKRDELFALRWLLRYKDRVARTQALSLLESMAKISERQGGEAVWGESGRTEHRLIEPVFRENYSTTLARDLKKVLFHLEPESHPMEICIDGKNVFPLIVNEVEHFSTPTELLNELPEKLYFPLGRGDSAVLAEIVNTDIRLQKVSRRRTDDQLVLSDLAGQGAVSQKSNIQEMIDHYVEERVVAELKRLEERLERAALSLTQPVTTTD